MAERSHTPELSSGSEGEGEGESGLAPLLRRRPWPAARRPSARDLPGPAACDWLRAHSFALAGGCLVPCACLVAWYCSAVASFTWQSWATIALTLEALLHQFSNVLN
jgi:hypothetical protein